MAFPVSPAGFLTSNQSVAYKIDRSLRFTQGNADYFYRIPEREGNRKIFTFSAWVKRARLGGGYIFTTAVGGGNSEAYIYFDGNDKFAYWDRAGGQDGAVIRSRAAFRDTSAWYHFVLSVDFTQIRAEDRVILYVNGIKADLSETNYPLVTDNSYFNSIRTHYIHSFEGSKTDMYLTEINFIDGQQLTSSSFGFFDKITGAWMPTKYQGLFGNNGITSESSPTNIDLLLVGGGGGGGGWGGGGGAGGIITGNFNVIPGSTYTITVGGGGTRGDTGYSPGGNGQNTTISGPGFTTNLTRLSSVEILVVGGGGGGGADIGGGGGGGGVLEQTIDVSNISTTLVQVGSGGIGSDTYGSIAVPALRGGNGGRSIAFNIRAEGGGGGGSSHRSDVVPGEGPSVGASGGGAQSNYATGTNVNGAAGLPGQGTSGGIGQFCSSNYYTGGGGGAGGNDEVNRVCSVRAGNGGPGKLSNLLGLPYYFGAGGGGAVHTSGTGGQGGRGGGGGGARYGAAYATYGEGGVDGLTPGGRGSAYNDTRGNYSGGRFQYKGGKGGTNTGSGGGGGAHYYGAGGDGGTGLVAIRYEGQRKANGGNIIYTTYINGILYTVHLFTSAGTSTFEILDNPNSLYSSTILTAVGGGGGGNWSSGSGSNGGSGGGGSGTGIGGSGILGQGSTGGNGSVYIGSTPYIGHGGGGGASYNGEGNRPREWGVTGGIGGPGIASLITGSLIYYGGGGGGHSPGGHGDTYYNNSNNAAGGIGGGGRGGNYQYNVAALDGTPNTGGGGGGAYGGLANGVNQLCGAGGSGVAILRYAGPQRALGGDRIYTTLQNNIYYTVHEFNTVGNALFTLLDSSISLDQSTYLTPYGKNGFFLNFSNIQTTNTLGYDYSRSSPAASLDTAWNSTCLLLRGEGVLSGTNIRFADTSIYNNTITPFGSASQGSFSPFDLATDAPYTSAFGGSVYLYTTDYLAVTPRPDMNLGTGNWTIEFFVKTVSNRNQMSIFNVDFDTLELYREDTGTGNGFQYFISFRNNFTPGIGSRSAQTIPFASNTNNSWEHVAIVRSGNNGYIFIDGVNKTAGGVADFSGININFTANGFTPWIGRRASQSGLFPDFYFNGYLTNFRITRGVARYTTNFIPPVESFNLRDSSTCFLMQGLSGGIIDATANNMLTVVGNGVVCDTRNRPFRGAREFEPLNTVEVFVVGGGGGGGANAGGGGGGGAVVFAVAPVTAGQSYPIRVGAGGAGARDDVNYSNNIVGQNGQSSFFNNIIATGGGGGGSYSSPGGTASGGASNGANGGGGGDPNGPGGIGVPPVLPAGITGVVNAGFTGSVGMGNGHRGGGGAGAGSSASGTIQGAAGIQFNFDGNNYFWAGGGGAGTWNQAPGNGGLGGGGGGASNGYGGGTGGGQAINAGLAGRSGNGAVNTGNGGANTGGGGGGGTFYAASFYPNSMGATGGSGIVMVRYPGAIQKAIGGNRVFTATIDGILYTIHEYTFTGNSSFDVVLPGNAIIYGTSSISFSGDIVTGTTTMPRTNFIYVHPQPQLGFGRHDFTIEGWFRFLPGKLNLGTMNLMSSVNYFVPGYNGNWVFRLESPTSIGFYSYDGQANAQPTAGSGFTVPTMSPNTWYYIALVRINDNLRVYLNGIESSTGARSITRALNDGAAHGLFIGRRAYDTYNFEGLMEDVRISNFARYNSNFFSPTKSLPDRGQQVYWNNGPGFSLNQYIENFGANYDSFFDVPTTYADNSNGRGNFPTWNINCKSPISLLTDGATQTQNSPANDEWWGTTATMAIGPRGKWYWEETVLQGGSYPNTRMIGIVRASRSPLDNNNAQFYPGLDQGGRAYYGHVGTIYPANASYGATYTTGDTIGVAIDLDNKRMFFSKNGTWQNSGDPVGGTGAAPTCTEFLQANDGEVFLPSTGHYRNNISYVNFGSRPFKYPIPTGYKTVCSVNLPNPRIIKANTFFSTQHYRGTSNTLNVTMSGLSGFPINVQGLSLQPDLLWIKPYSANSPLLVLDTARSNTRTLSTNSQGSEVTDVNGLISFNRTGFTVGTSRNFNLSSDSFATVGWRDNDVAGLEIKTYTGAGSPQVISHNLQAIPSMIIIKQRNPGPVPINSPGHSWFVWHNKVNTPDANWWKNYARLDSPNQFVQWPTADPGITAAPTINSISLGSSFINQIGNTYAMYIFKEVEGFSKFGIYGGNNSVDGAFVYCGFRPKWIMYKRRDAADTVGWLIFDTGDPINNNNPIGMWYSAASTTFGRTTTTPDIMDVLSNGFKFRFAGEDGNASNSYYIFAAFAEEPFKYARAR